MHRLLEINLSFLLLFGSILCNGKYFEYNLMDQEDSVQSSRSMMVSLRYDCQEKNDPTTHCCSGIILTKSYILTAADCVDSFSSDLTIVVVNPNRFEASQTIRKIDQIIIHPNWSNDRYGFKYNIALLHISNPLDFTKDKYKTRTFSPIDLNYPSNKTQLSIIQWNSVKQNFDDIRMVNLQQNQLCKESVHDIQQQFCVRFQRANSCNYESGESIFQWTDNGGMPIGILSSVIDETNGNCLKIYTRLIYYHKWIVSILNNEHLTSDSAVTKTNFATNDIKTYECDMEKVPCGCSVRNVVLSSTRIIGGEEAVPHSWSMTVSVRLNNSDQHSCGGSILSQSYVLTSAHCMDDALPLEVSVAAGMHNRIQDFFPLRYVHEIFIHPNWNRSDGTYQNDIAVLFLLPPLPVDGNENLVRTCVPYRSSTNESGNYLSDGSHLATVGWGSIQNGSNNMSVTLQQASIYTQDNHDSLCSQSTYDAEKQFCAGMQGGDSCQGDEGGPVLQWKDTYWEQVGITSYGGKCDEVGSSRIFTRLAYYTDWIESVTGISFTTTTPKPPPIPTSYSCNKTSSCGCGLTDVALVSSRIVGGENAIDNSWPMIVSIRFNGTRNHSCAGTIVSKSYILTVAHCIRRVPMELRANTTIAAGMTNRSDPLQIIRHVDRIYMHPNYTSIPGDNRHDIALLHINQPFTFEFDSKVRKTCIHRINPPVPTNQYPKNGTRLSVIGWGAVQSGDSRLPEILQQVEVFAIDNEEPSCVNSINNTQLQFCAGLLEGGKDSCQGDSGGPIFQWTGQYWEQVGLVSYGRGCALAGFPGIYTRLSYYYQWMQEILERDGEHLEPSISSPSSRAYKYKPSVSIFGLFILLLQLY